MVDKDDRLVVDDDDWGDEEDTQKNKYLTFHMNGESFAIAIAHVMQIIGGIQPITSVPDRADYEKGVINLRGKVVPVIDVRLRFALPEASYTDRTCIVVLNVEEKTAGLIVDEVAEVMDIPEESISAPPDSGNRQKNRFILGMGLIGEQVKIILDVNKLLSDME